MMNFEQPPLEGASLAELEAHIALLVQAGKLAVYYRQKLEQCKLDVKRQADEISRLTDENRALTKNNNDSVSLVEKLVKENQRLTVELNKANKAKDDVVDSLNEQLQSARFQLADVTNQLNRHEIDAINRAANTASVAHSYAIGLGNSTKPLDSKRADDLIEP